MKDAEFKRKTNKAFALMVEKGLRKNHGVPWSYRLLWWMGLKVPPAVFNSFGANVLLLGLYFGFFYGLIMWFVTWHPDGMPPSKAIIMSSFAGLFYGVCMAAVFRNRRKAKGLPEWKAL